MIKSGDVVEALVRQENESIYGWQRSKIKELKVSFYFYLSWLFISLMDYLFNNYYKTLFVG